MRGVVQVMRDAMRPHARTVPARAAGDPLPGAKIVGFTWPAPNQYSLEYDVRGERRFVNYTLDGDNNFTFQFVDGAGNVRTQSYRRNTNQPPPPRANRNREQ